MERNKKADNVPPVIPEAEQPYKIPYNWCWVTLGSITDIIGGGTPSTKNKAYYENGDIPWISPADLSNYSEAYISHGAKNISCLGLKIGTVTACRHSMFINKSADWLCGNSEKSFIHKSGV